eukprot:TRINITY_DN2287_c0_g1_i1.p1 TRINITY_DN2287_c0_g1~~TRINITY_DN2287_c0_g1_i1.p1  ORF type:complete len:1117 (+),score=353.27 TRINITY_DN2287_c0_g1_i1:74-3424(+)
MSEDEQRRAEKEANDLIANPDKDAALRALKSAFIRARAELGNAKLTQNQISASLEDSKKLHRDALADYEKLKAERDKLKEDARDHLRVRSELDVLQNQAGKERFEHEQQTRTLSDRMQQAEQALRDAQHALEDEKARHDEGAERERFRQAEFEKWQRDRDRDKERDQLRLRELENERLAQKEELEKMKQKDVEREKERAREGEQLREKARQMEREKQEWEREREELEAERERLRQQMRDLLRLQELERQKATKEKGDGEAERDELRRQIEEKDRANAKAKADAELERQRDRERERERERQAREEKDKLEREKDALRQKARQDNDDKDREIDQLKRELENLIREKEDIELENEDLKRQLEEREKQIHKSKADNEAERQRERERERERERAARDEKDRLEREREAVKKHAKAEVEEREREIEALKREIETLRRELEDALEEKDSELKGRLQEQQREMERRLQELAEVATREREKLQKERDELAAREKRIKDDVLGQARQEKAIILAQVQQDREDLIDRHQRERDELLARLELVNRRGREELVHQGRKIAFTVAQRNGQNILRRYYLKLLQHRADKQERRRNHRVQLASNLELRNAKIQLRRYYYKLYYFSILSKARNSAAVRLENSTHRRLAENYWLKWYMWFMRQKTIRQARINGAMQQRRRKLSKKALRESFTKWRKFTRRQQAIRQGLLLMFHRNVLPLLHMYYLKLQRYAIAKRQRKWEYAEKLAWQNNRAVLGSYYNKWLYFYVIVAENRKRNYNLAKQLEESNNQRGVLRVYYRKWSLWHDLAKERSRVAQIEKDIQEYYYNWANFMVSSKEATLKEEIDQIQDRLRAQSEQLGLREMELDRERAEYAVRSAEIQQYRERERAEEANRRALQEIERAAEDERERQRMAEREANLLRQRQLEEALQQERMVKEQELHALRAWQQDFERERMERERMREEQMEQMAYQQQDLFQQNLQLAAEREALNEELKRVSAILNAAKEKHSHDMVNLRANWEQMNEEGAALQTRVEHIRMRQVDEVKAPLSPHSLSLRASPGIPLPSPLLAGDDRRRDDQYDELEQLITQIRDKSQRRRPLAGERGLPPPPTTTATSTTRILTTPTEVVHTKHFLSHTAK